jgi:hypothetical protein
VKRLVLIVEVFAESRGRDFSDFVLKYLGNWESLLFKNVEKEHQFVLALFTVVYFCIQFLDLLFGLLHQSITSRLLTFSHFCDFDPHSLNFLFLKIDFTLKQVYLGTKIFFVCTEIVRHLVLFLFFLL